MTIIAIVEEAFFEHTGGGRQRKDDESDDIETHIPFDDDPPPYAEEKDVTDEDAAMRGTKRSLPAKLQAILKQLPSKTPPSTPTSRVQPPASRPRFQIAIDTANNTDTPDYVTALMATLSSAESHDRDSSTMYEADNWQILRARLLATINSIDSTIESKQEQF